MAAIVAVATFCAALVVLGTASSAHGATPAQVKADKSTIRAVIKAARTGAIADTSRQARPAVARVLGSGGATTRVDSIWCVTKRGAEWPAALVKGRNLRGAARGCFVNVSFKVSGHAFRAESAYFVAVKTKSRRSYLTAAVLAAG